jgi:hypothetical protein
LASKDQDHLVPSLYTSRDVEHVKDLRQWIY